MASHLAQTASRLPSLPWRSWLPAVFCLVALLAATHVPVTDGPSINNADKAVHLGAYLVLTLTVLFGLERTAGRLQACHFFAVWLFASFLGAGDEITQSFSLFHRTTDIVDWMADVAGVLAGIAVYQVWRPWFYAILQPGGIASGDA